MLSNIWLLGVSYESAIVSFSCVGVVQHQVFGGI